MTLFQFLSPCFLSMPQFCSRGDWLLGWLANLFLLSLVSFCSRMTPLVLPSTEKIPLPSSPPVTNSRSPIFFFASFSLSLSLTVFFLPPPPPPSISHLEMCSQKEHPSLPASILRPSFLLSCTSLPFKAALPHITTFFQN